MNKCHRGFHRTMSEQSKEAKFIVSDILPGLRELRDRWNSYCLSEVGVVTARSGIVPDGYLECDGSAVSQWSWPELYAAYSAAGLPFGSSGPGLFNLPSLTPLDPNVRYYVFAGAFAA